MQDQHSERMSASETRAAGGLALVYAFRMLGMFMLLPVLATYGSDLQGATPVLIGVAIGAYGLTQGLLQIPFGVLSDRIGRLPVIYGGLLVFAAGAAVAAMADSIWGVIAGRVLQGVGAISAALMALLSDLTREQHRTKAMAMIGMSIGLSFAAAMVLGPLLTRAFGLSGLFWATCAMALLGLPIVRAVIPPASRPHHHLESGVDGARLWPTLRHPQLLRLNLGIGLLHAILMASFVVLPLALVEYGELPRDAHWPVYLGAMVTGFVGMVPFIIYAEKKRRMKQVLTAAVALLLLCELYFGFFARSLPTLVVGFVLFFTVFNLLEASLPSLVSKIAPPASKGTAMGLYATSQFIGAALGGMLGGWLYQLGGLGYVFGGCALLGAGWLLAVLSMREPPYVSSQRWPLTAAALADPTLLGRVHGIPGVSDAVIVAEEAALYIKVDTQQLDDALLGQVLEEAASTQNA